MNKPTESDALTRQLCTTLEQASLRPDPVLERALATARQEALASATGHRRWQPWALASGLALAASLTAVAILPNAMGTPSRLAPPLAEAVLAAPNVDPEMLEDMDFLLAMGGQS